MKKVFQVVVPILIVAFGVAAAVGIMRLKPKPQKSARPPATPSVDVLTVTRAAQTARIRATGVVEPARQASVSPQVNGRVVWTAEELVPGGRVKAGQGLLKVDPREYVLAVEQQQSAAEQARLNLELEQSQQGARKKEFELLDESDVKASPLALRVPQVKAAEVAVKSAESGLERARLNLERTTVWAPFNALVTQESAEKGQFVSPGQPFATLIGTDRFWVTVQLPVEKLVYLTLASEGGEPSEVTVVQDLGPEGRLVKRGRALRLKGGLDPATRTAQLVVGVDDPLDPAPGAQGAASLPLLPGAFVEVLIDGKEIEETWRVPRTAVQGGDEVWVLDDEDRLRRRKVSIAWRTDEDLYVTGGLRDGERVVVSPLALPVEGMKVEIARDRAASAAAELSRPPSPTPGG